MPWIRAEKDAACSQQPPGKQVLCPAGRLKLLKVLEVLQFTWGVAASHILRYTSTCCATSPALVVSPRSQQLTTAPLSDEPLSGVCQLEWMDRKGLRKRQDAKSKSPQTVCQELLHGRRVQLSTSKSGGLRHGSSLEMKQTGLFFLICQ